MHGLHNEDFNSAQTFHPFHFQQSGTILNIDKSKLTKYKKTAYWIQSTAIMSMARSSKWVMCNVHENENYVIVGYRSVSSTQPSFAINIRNSNYKIIFWLDIRYQQNSMFMCTICNWESGITHTHANANHRIWLTK